MYWLQTVIFSCRWFIPLSGPLLVVVSGFADDQEPPRLPDPPVLVASSSSQAPSIARSSGSITIQSAPSQEWTLHKTINGDRPSGVEQQYLWLMNRARSNPTVEGLWLSMIQDFDVQGATDYFDVDMEVLRQEFAALAANPPAAFDRRLHDAAVEHSQYLISIDGQTHDGQLTRVQNSGFKYSTLALSVFSYCDSGTYGHCGFNIDWGNGSYGMQDGRGHRGALMGSRTNVGVGVVVAPDGLDVGPEVTTINYGTAQTYYTDHYNRFLVGTVWEDANDNRYYDPGEGIGGVTVMPDHGTYFAVTGDAGGWAVPVDAGTYEVTFSGGSLQDPVVKIVEVGSVSVLVRWLEFPEEPANPSLALDLDQQTVSASWDYYFGQPSAMRTCTELGSWELIPGTYTELNGRLFWQGNVPHGEDQRFWQIRGWNH